MASSMSIPANRTIGEELYLVHLRRAGIIKSAPADKTSRGGDRAQVKRKCSSTGGKVTSPCADIHAKKQKVISPYDDERDPKVVQIGDEVVNLDDTDCHISGESLGEMMEREGRPFLPIARTFSRDGEGNEFRHLYEATSWMSWFTDETKREPVTGEVVFRVDYFLLFKGARGADYVGHYFKTTPFSPPEYVSLLYALKHENFMMRAMGYCMLSWLYKRGTTRFCQFKRREVGTPYERNTRLYGAVVDEAKSKCLRDYVEQMMERAITDELEELKGIPDCKTKEDLLRKNGLNMGRLLTYLQREIPKKLKFVPSEKAELSRWYEEEYMKNGDT